MFFFTYNFFFQSLKSGLFFDEDNVVLYQFFLLSLVAMLDISAIAVPIGAAVMRCSNSVLSFPTREFILGVAVILSIAALLAVFGEFKNLFHMLLIHEFSLERLDFEGKESPRPIQASVLRMSRILSSGVLVQPSRIAA